MPGKLGGGYLSGSPLRLGTAGRLAGKPRAPRDPNAPRVAPDVSQTIPWAPFYTIHKIMAACSICITWAATSRRSRCSKAWRIGRIRGRASKSEEHMQEILNTEYAAWQRCYTTWRRPPTTTGGPRRATVHQEGFRESAAMGRDELRGLHTNAHPASDCGGAAATRFPATDASIWADFFYYTVSTGRRM